LEDGAGVRSRSFNGPTNRRIGHRRRGAAGTLPTVAGTDLRGSER
jgi:hypothetical protein